MEREKLVLRLANGYVRARERGRTLNLMFFKQPCFVSVEGGGLGVVY